MALEVIGAGFGRTGTASLKQALEILGFVKCHHMSEVMRSRKQALLWHQLAVDGSVDWDDVFEGYRAAVDFPSSVYYRELLEHYPEARVILSVREPDAWYRSALRTIHAIMKNQPRWLFPLIPRMRILDRMVDRIVWQGVFDGRFEDEEHAKQVFRDHIEKVKSVVPPDKLLVYQITDGWAPLCNFLDVPQPEGVTFPRTNEAREMIRVVRVMKALRLLPYGVAVSVAVWILL